MKGIVSLNTLVDDGEGGTVEVGDLIADPETEWRAGPLPDEPRWERPPRSAAEALARAEATRAFWRAMMRAPFHTGSRRKRRPLRTSDLIRPQHLALECERCGEPFRRTGRRGPVPRLCPDCAHRSRNRPGR